MPDTTLPDNGFNRIAIYRIYQIVLILADLSTRDQVTGLEKKMECYICTSVSAGSSLKNTIQGSTFFQMARHVIWSRSPLLRWHENYLSDIFLSYLVVFSLIPVTLGLPNQRLPRSYRFSEGTNRFSNSTQMNNFN